MVCGNVLDFNKLINVFNTGTYIFKYKQEKLIIMDDMRGEITSVSIDGPCTITHTLTFSNFRRNTEQ